MRAAFKTNVEKSAGLGCMVSLDLPPDMLDVEPGLPLPHITIVYLGKEVDDETFQRVCAIAQTVAAKSPPPQGTIGGLGTFPASKASDGKTPVFAIPDVPGLDALRMVFSRFNASEHKAFKPHVTVAYVGAGEALPEPVPVKPVMFESLSVHRGGDVISFPFSGGPPPKLRPASSSLSRCKNCCLFAHDRCVKYGNWEVGIDQTCDGWGLALDDHVEKAATPAEEAARQAAMEVLRQHAGSTAELEAVLRQLHGDGFLQGAHDAAHAAGATIVGSLQGVTSQLPADYWTVWQAGYGDAASALAQGGLLDLLEDDAVTIQGMTDTSISRIGDMLASAVGKGLSMEAAGRQINEVVEDPARAELIADTEYARAMTVAAETTYDELGIEEEEWLAEGDACPECAENAAAGPIPTGSEWPNGSVPVHPRCRCAQAPRVIIEPTEPEGVE